MPKRKTGTYRAASDVSFVEAGDYLVAYKNVSDAELNQYPLYGGSFELTDDRGGGCWSMHSKSGPHVVDLTQVTFYTVMGPEAKLMGYQGPWDLAHDVHG